MYERQIGRVFLFLSVFFFFFFFFFFFYITEKPISNNFNQVLEIFDPDLFILLFEDWTVTRKQIKIKLRREGVVSIGSIKSV